MNFSFIVRSIFMAIYGKSGEHCIFLAAFALHFSGNTVREEVHHFIIETKEPTGFAVGGDRS